MLPAFCGQGISEKDRTQTADTINKINMHTLTAIATAGIWNGTRE